MARGSISNNINANELVSGIGQNKKLDLAAIERNEEAIQRAKVKIRAKWLKKGIQDEAELRKKIDEVLSLSDDKAKEIGLEGKAFAINEKNERVQAKKIFDLITRLI